MSNRDDFSEGTKKILQERVGNRCSSPTCRCLTSGPNENPEKATRIGVAAHITSAAQNGPRYDPDLSVDERRSILNGIWLCQNCAKLVDADPFRYTVAVILQWKSIAEERARLELEGKEVSEELLYEGFGCPHCGRFVKKGVTVCVGCSDVYYGSMPSQRKEEFEAGMTYGLLGYLFFVAFLPQLLASWTGWPIPFLWGANVLVVLAIGAIVTIGFGKWLTDSKDAIRRRQPPVFVHARY